MGIPMYMRIKDYVRKQIEYGEWTEGMLIPTEADFMKLFGVSRITVANAMRQLVDEGVIYRIQGKGSYVSKKVAVPDVFELAGMFQLNGTLEQMNVPGPHVCESFQLIDATEEIAEVLQIEVGQKIYEILRTKYVEGGAPMNFERLYLPQSIYLGVDAKRLQNEHLAVICREIGIQSGKTMMSMEPVICDSVIEKVLHVKQGAPLMKINLEIYDSKEKPIAFEELIGIGKTKKITLKQHL